MNLETRFKDVEASLKWADKFSLVFPFRCEGSYLKYHILLEQIIVHTMLSTFGTHTNEEECWHD